VEGLEFSASPRLVFTKATQEIIAVGQVFVREENLSETPLEKGGARNGHVTYTHTGSVEPFSGRQERSSDCFSKM
jgi:hypothetical protein